MATDINNINFTASDMRKIWAELRERFLDKDINIINGNDVLQCMQKNIKLAQFALHYLHNHSSHGCSTEKNEQEQDKDQDQKVGCCLRIVVPTEEWEALFNSTKQKISNRNNMLRRSNRRNKLGMVLSNFYGLTLAQVRLFLCMIRKETQFKTDTVIAIISTNNESEEYYSLNLGDFAIRYVCNKHFSDYQRKKKQKINTTEEKNC
jgi:hypothetical protein